VLPAKFAIASMDDAARKDLVVCGNDVLEEELRQLFSFNIWKFGKFLDYYTVPDLVKDLKCDALVLSTRVFENDKLLDQWRCQNRYVAVAHVMSRPVAMAASGEVAQGLSYIIRRLSAEGQTYSSIEQSKEFRHLPVCPMDVPDDIDVDDARLYPDQLSGVFLVVAVCALLAIIIDNPSGVMLDPISSMTAISSVKRAVHWRSSKSGEDEAETQELREMREMQAEIKGLYKIIHSQREMMGALPEVLESRLAETASELSELSLARAKSGPVVRSDEAARLAELSVGNSGPVVRRDEAAFERSLSWPSIVVE